jgi:hypothetical protein
MGEGIAFSTNGAETTKPSHGEIKTSIFKPHIQNQLGLDHRHKYIC